MNTRRSTPGPGTRVKAIVKKEFRQMSRDKGTMAAMVLLPVFLLVMFGYAIDLDVKNLSLAVYNEDKSATSRDFVGSFLHSEYFTYAGEVGALSDFDRLLTSGEVTVGLIIPEDFTSRLISGKSSNVEVLVDGTNSTYGAAALGYAQAIAASFPERENLGPRRASSSSPPIDLRTRIWYNPRLESAQYLVPGLIAMILVISAVIATALSVVREKERGTMEQIIVSPIHARELVIGKLIPPFVVSVVLTGMIMLASALMFNVHVKGSYLEFSLVTLLFLLGCLGLGLLISSIADSQQVAFTIAITVTFLPSFLLSGFVFPIRNMPVFVQAVTYIVPARYFLDALRAIMLRGVGIAAFWKDVLFLTLIALLTLAGGSARLRKGRVG